MVQFFVTPDADPAFLVLGHEDVEGDLWASLWFVSLIIWASDFLA
jgi:hypothetical protein